MRTNSPTAGGNRRHKWGRKLAAFCLHTRNLKEEIHRQYLFGRKLGQANCAQKCFTIFSINYSSFLVILLTVIVLHTNFCSFFASHRSIQSSCGGQQQSPRTGQFFICSSYIGEVTFASERCAIHLSSRAIHRLFGSPTPPMSQILYALLHFPPFNPPFKFTLTISINFPKKNKVPFSTSILIRFYYYSE